MKKSLISALMVLCLAFSMLSVSVCAMEEDGTVGNTLAASESTGDGWLSSAVEAPDGFKIGAGASVRTGLMAASESCGDNLTWSLNDGELIISGTGAMTTFTNATAAPWYGMADKISKITVQAGVTSVSQYAFADLENAMAVSIADTVSEIGAMAFVRCSSLTSVTLPDAVREIPYALFADCFSLTSVTAHGITAIGEYAFQDTKVSSFVINKNLTEISPLSFFKAPITAFTVESGNSVYFAVNGVLYTDGGKTLFAYPQGSDATSFTIPSAVTRVNDLAFAYAKFREVVIPDSVTELGESAFQGAALASVTIPDSVKTAGYFTFYGSDLETVTLGTGLAVTPYQMFRQCTSLKRINFPSTPLELGAHTFGCCTALTEVTLPRNIGKIGSGCFGECTALKTFTSTGLKEIPFQAFINCSSLENLSLDGIETIYRAAFIGCSSLTSVTLPATTDYVHNIAFPANTQLNCLNPELSGFGTNGLARIQDISITGTDYYTEAYQVLNLVNAERSKQGLGALEMDQTLLDCAMQRAAEIAVLFSHTRPDGSSIFEMDSKIYGENIAVGQTSAAQVMESWMDSEGHRENILTSGFQSIGIGCFKIGNTYYWVQDFGVSTAETLIKPADCTVSETVRAGLYEIPEATTSTGIIWGETGGPYTINFAIALGSETILAGGTAQASVVVTNSSFGVPVTIDQTGCIWSSADNSIATVSGTGLIKGMAEGSTDIQLKLGIVALNKTISVGCPCTKFKDFNPDAWYHEYLDFAVNRGLINGIEPDLIGPDDTMTRAMLVTILYRYEGQPSVEGLLIPYSDVPEDQYYADAVRWASANNIINGTTPTTFSPDDDLLREQLAAILYRYAAYKGNDVSEQADLSVFPDNSRINEYAVTPISWAVSQKIILGSEGYLNPLGNATRAEAATMLQRYITNIG